MKRTVLAVLVGYIVVAGLVLLTHYLVSVIAGSKEVFAEPGIQYMLIGAGILSGMIGGYVAAWISAHSPVRHALYAGALGVVLSVLAYFLAGRPELAWYLVIVIVIVLPSAWIGGLIRAKRQPA